MEAGMQYRWKTPGWTPDKQAQADTLAQSLAVPNLVARLMVRSGICDPVTGRKFLEPKLTDLHDPALIPGILKASLRLARAAQDKQPIVIYGDYDVDGVTASAILFHMFKLAGAKVATYVPHRIDEGYGLNAEAIAAIADYQFEGADSVRPADGNIRPVIVSVDCGITATEPALVARARGVDLIITDHHEFNPHALPDAYALVHPRLLDDSGKATYPFEHLCGAGVAFKLAWQFAKVVTGTDKLPVTYREMLVHLLPFASLGTISDIVPLVGENRVIAHAGLSRIKHTPFDGLNALIDASSLRDDKVSAYDVGFKLGPRLNASGRMGHAKEAVKLFTTADKPESARLAEMLGIENNKRRSTEKSIFEHAREMVSTQGWDRPQSRCIVVGHGEWHQGVVGIVASRLVEAFARPAVVLAFDDETGMAHGSARSVDGVSIHEALTQCAPYLTRFGGHAMAAGMHLKVSDVDAFRNALIEAVNRKLSPNDLVPVLMLSEECDGNDINVQTLRQIDRLAPFGRDNPSPVLCLRGAVITAEPKLMGTAGAHLALTIKHSGRTLRAVGFRMGEIAGKLARGQTVDIAFEGTINAWNGVESAEAHIKDIRLA
jgi:single-stranded-DNA-specific exonuclease